VDERVRVAPERQDTDPRRHRCRSKGYQHVNIHKIKLPAPP